MTRRGRSEGFPNSSGARNTSPPAGCSTGSQVRGWGQAPDIEGGVLDNAIPAAKTPALGIGKTLSKIVHPYALVPHVVFARYRKTTVRTPQKSLDTVLFRIVHINLGERPFHALW